MTSPTRCFMRTIALPTVRALARHRIGGVTHTRAGAVQCRRWFAASHQLLEGNRPECCRIFREVTPTAHVQIPRDVVRVSGFDSLLVLQCFPQVATADLREVTGRRTEARHLGNAIRRATRDLSG